MSREIKFRVWDKKTRIMHKVCSSHDSLISDSKGNIVYMNLQNGSGGDEYELMEWTGLKDMHGNDIYDDDILKNVEYGHRMKVRWGLENVSYAGWCAEWLDEKFDALLYNATLKNCEIIGNIYEGVD